MHVDDIRRRNDRRKALYDAIHVRVPRAEGWQEQLCHDIEELSNSYRDDPPHEAIDQLLSENAALGAALNDTRKRDMNKHRAFVECVKIYVEDENVIDRMRIVEAAHRLVDCHMLAKVDELFSEAVVFVRWQMQVAARPTWIPEESPCDS